MELVEMRTEHEKELQSPLKILQEIKKLESDPFFLEESVVHLLQENLFLARLVFFHNDFFFK
jgi:hypothetical protein